MPTDAQYRTRIRTLVSDNHRVQDDMKAQCNGANLKFICANQNILATPLPLKKVDDADWTSAGITITDASNGLITLSTAPANTLTILYHYNFFNDVELDEVRNIGLERVGINVSNYTQVSECLFDVVTLYGASALLYSRGSDYASIYDVSVGAKSFQKGKVTDNYQGLAKSLYDQAEKAREDCYKGQGKQFTPYAFGQNVLPCGEPFQPRR